MSLHIAVGADKQTVPNLSRGLWRLRRLLFHQKECSLPGGSDSKCTAETPVHSSYVKLKKAFVCVKKKERNVSVVKGSVCLSFHDS